MSTPAVEPQFLPAGRSPQFLVTTEVGLGIPAPLIGLPPVASAPQPVTRTNIDAIRIDNILREDDITAP
jgi:hypothetical protein